MRIIKNIALLLILNSGFSIFAQQEAELYIPRDIKEAYDKKTRSYDGKPGPEYFQNQVDYFIKAKIDPKKSKIKANAIITFHNKSDRNLRYIVFKTCHDVFKAGVIRNRPVDPADVGLEMVITKMSVNGENYDLNNPNSFFTETTTNKVLSCNTALYDSSVINISWESTIPRNTHQRFGSVDKSSFFLAYWYPQISVFDDINGWDVYDYNNLNEMYNEYGNFEVEITVPKDYIVWATGELQNPESVLTRKYLNRFEESKESEKPVEIINNNDLKAKSPRTIAKWNTWRFNASMVNEFAFGLSDHHLWTASSFIGSDRKRTHIQTAFLDESKNFRLIPEYANLMLKIMTDSIFGYPFPYPSITIFNGLDGMEFPMIVNDREMDSPGGTYFLSTHEIAHSYFPFLVGINQRKHGWLDEGLITMLGTETHIRKLDEYNFRNTYLEWYPLVAGTQKDVPSMVNSVFITDEIYQEHEYVRSSMAFWTLRDILGEKMFQTCLLEFINRWKFKHPTPYDLFFTFNDVCGENLNWYFQPWFLEFAYPDIGISNVDNSQSISKIEISNIGGMPIPGILEVFSGSKDPIEIKLDARIWSNNNKTYLVDLPENISPAKIVLRTDNYPDVNQENNLWSLDIQ